MKKMSIDDKNGVLFENRIGGLLTPDELAESLGKSPQTIRNWIAKRIIPFVTLGNTNFIRMESFEDWVKRKENKPWE
ncbi:MAG: helix-turn-helix domain-containing protein [Oligoflexales bacterium]